MSYPKFVYILINQKDDYLKEQTLVSLYSLRLTNPDASTVLVTDEKTREFLCGEDSKIRDYVNEVLVAPLPQEISPDRKYRHLKTSLRNLIKGDFIFLDNKTIIVRPLTELYNLGFDLGAVPEGNIFQCGNEELKKHRDSINNNTINNKKGESDNFFNEGVLLVKDSEKTRLFFEEWNKLVQKENINLGKENNKSSLSFVNSLMGSIVQVIDGKFNCQLSGFGAMDYIWKPYIINYGSDREINNNLFFPLQDEKWLSIIREHGITEEIKRIICNPQSSWLEYCRVLGGKELKIYNSPMAKAGRKLSRDYKWINRMVSRIYGCFGFKI